MFCKTKEMPEWRDHLDFSVYKRDAHYRCTVYDGINIMFYPGTRIYDGNKQQDIHIDLLTDFTRHLLLCSSTGTGLNLEKISPPCRSWVRSGRFGRYHFI